MKIAHRGYSAKYPENTLLAFSKALEHGAQGIEFDVHCSADGIPVVIHDETIDRTTDGKGRVAAMTLPQLKSLHISGEETIPTLDEVIALAGGKAKLFIELKAEAAAAPVAQMLKRLLSGNPYKPEDFMLISFHHEWLAKAKSLCATLPVGATFEKLPADFVERTKAIRAEAILPCIAYVNASHMEAARAAGLAAYCWTCNSDEDIIRAKSLQLDGIMTDWIEKL